MTDETQKTETQVQASKQTKAGLDKGAVAKGAAKLVSGFGAKLFAQVASDSRVIETMSAIKTETNTAKEKFAKATEGLDDKLVDAAARAALKATETGTNLKGQAAEVTKKYGEQVAVRMQEIEAENNPAPEPVKKKGWSWRR